MLMSTLGRAYTSFEGVAGSNASLAELASEMEDLLSSAGSNLDAEHQKYVANYTARVAKMVATNPYARTACKAGFGGGRASLRLLAGTKLRTLEFGDENGRQPATFDRMGLDFLNSKFPSRISMTWGDPYSTLGRFFFSSGAGRAARCDLSLVEGGDYQVAARALGSFAHHASGGHEFIVQGTPCDASACADLNDVIRDHLEDGCIETTERIQLAPDYGYTVGYFKPCRLWPNTPFYKIT